MQNSITMSSRHGAASGGLAMLDVIVLIAMAITAAALAAGLTLQAGLPLIPVLIATVALFLVMAASFARLGRGSRAGGGDRLAELEEALEIIDTDLQRIDRVEDEVARLDLLTDRVERLDQALRKGAPSDYSGGQARTEELATEFENVYARIESLRADVEAENRSQRDRIASDLGVLEDLIKRLSNNLTAASSVAASVEAVISREPPRARPEPPVVVVEEEDIVVEAAEGPEPAPEPEPLFAFETEEEDAPEAEPEMVIEAEPVKDDEPEIRRLLFKDVEDASEAETVVEAEASEESEIADEAETATPAMSAFLDDDEAEDAQMRDIIRHAVETGGVDLYLQPTVTLPDRKVHYFEALTRIRTAGDELILPGDYIPVAKRAALMPLIDNVLLVRSVQVLRRLGTDSRIRGLFCNVSMHSLLDPDYFPELIELMEENSGLSEHLIFEVSQPEMLGLTDAELGCLDTLGALGYNFCLDNVSDLDTDFATLSDRYFRYVKLSAARFLGSPGRTASGLKRDLDGLGIQLIIEKVEEEGDVAELLDRGIEFAQGYLFGQPRPMNAALSIELAGAGA
jgi:cyclic-di-GMP phosphodiesterase TipF (flagellum assembly factor)